MGRKKKLLENINIDILFSPLSVDISPHEGKVQDERPETLM